MNERTNMKNDIMIRLATKKDIVDIFTIHQASVHGMASHVYPKDIIDEWSPIPTPENNIKELEIQLKTSSEIMIVAENHQNIVGFGSLHPKISEIGSLFVHPNCSRQGIGTILLDHLENIAIKTRLKYLGLDASINAVKFYQSQGYHIVEHSFFILKSGKQMMCVKMIKKLIHS